MIAQDRAVIPLAIHACNPGPITGAGNWTWLIPGRVPTLIDAGVGAPGHLDALLRALDGTPLAQVLVTHGHIDHASGAPVLSTRMPGARFAKMAWPERDAQWPVDWQPVADGDTVSAGDASLQAVHTPGHAPDHLCFWNEETRTLFCGDLAIEGSTVWIPSGPEGDLAAYLASIERVLALNPARMLPAHGPVIEEPAQVLRSYLAHRRDREEQVLEALRHGVAAAEAIVARVYGPLKETLAPFARDTVTAHLLKLEREGRVHCASGAWHIIEP